MSKYGSKMKELVFGRGSWSYHHHKYAEFLSQAWEGRASVPASVMDELLDHTASVRLPILVGCSTVNDWQSNVAVSNSLQQVERDWKKIQPIRKKYIEEEANPALVFNSNSNVDVSASDSQSARACPLLVRQVRPHLPAYGIEAAFSPPGAWTEAAWVYNLRSKFSTSKCFIGEMLRQTVRTRKLLHGGIDAADVIVEGDRAWVPLLAVRPACAFLAEEFYVGREPWTSPKDGGLTGRWCTPPAGWALQGHEVRMPHDGAPYNGCDENLFGWRSLPHNTRGTFGSEDTTLPSKETQLLMSSFEFPVYATRSVGPPVLMDGVFVDLARLILRRAGSVSAHVPHNLRYASDRLVELLYDRYAPLTLIESPLMADVDLLVKGMTTVFADLYTPCADTVCRWHTELVRNGLPPRSTRVTGQEAASSFVALEDQRTAPEIENLCVRMARVYVTLLHASSLPLGICNVYNVSSPGGWLRNVEYWPLAQHFIRDLHTLWAFLNLMESAPYEKTNYREIDHSVNMPSLDAVLQLLAWNRIGETLYDHQQTIDALKKVPAEIRAETYNGVNWCPAWAR